MQQKLWHEVLFLLYPRWSNVSQCVAYPSATRFELVNFWCEHSSNIRFIVFKTSLFILGRRRLSRFRLISLLWFLQKNLVCLVPSYLFQALLCSFFSHFLTMASLNLSEIPNLRSGPMNCLSALASASLSAFSFPVMPSCPGTQSSVTLLELPSLTTNVKFEFCWVICGPRHFWTAIFHISFSNVSRIILLGSILPLKIDINIIITLVSKVESKEKVYNIVYDKWILRKIIHKVIILLQDAITKALHPPKTFPTVAPFHIIYHCTTLSLILHI